MLNRRVLVLVGAIALLSSTCAFAVPKAKHANTGIAAVVNGEKITSQQLRDTMYKWYAPQGVEEMILTRLVDDAAKKAGVVVTDAEVKAKLAEIENRASAGGTSFSDFLKKSGKTLDYAYAMIRMDLQANGVLRKSVTVTPAELADYRRASHILIMNNEVVPGVTPTNPEKSAADTDKANKEKAEKIIQEIKAGMPFDEAAKKYSQDTMSKIKGGDLGWFTKGRMTPEFEKAVYALKNVGDISEPIKTPFGYHIIKLTGIGSQVKGAEKKELEDQIIQSKINVRDWIMKLRQDAKVQSEFVAQATPRPAGRPAGHLAPLPVKVQTRTVPGDNGHASPPPPPPAPGK